MSSCDVFTCLFALDPQNEMLLLSTFRSVVIISWLVYWVGVEKCAARQKEIGNHRF